MISRKPLTLFGMKGPITDFYIVVPGGKMYDLVKSMCLEIRCAVKIGDKQSPTLFNVYINELAVQPDQCAVPGKLKSRFFKRKRERAVIPVSTCCFPSQQYYSTV